MTRFIEIENASSSRAKMPAELANGNEIESLTEWGRAMSAALLRPLRRAAMATELHRLDDRMLADIGVVRGDIDGVAEVAMADGSASIGSLLAVLPGMVVRAVAVARRRRIAERELLALDDRLLADIGLTRGEVPDFVARLTASKSGGDANDIIREVLGMTATGDRRNLRPADARADTVVEDLALRLFRPANNGHAPKAA